jgi:hypothetical protein
MAITRPPKFFNFGRIARQQRLANRVDLRLQNGRGWASESN